MVRPVENILWPRVRQAQHVVPPQAEPHLQVPCGGLPQQESRGQEQPVGGQGDQDGHRNEEGHVIYVPGFSSDIFSHIVNI